MTKTNSHIALQRTVPVRIKPRFKSRRRLPNPPHPSPGDCIRKAMAYRAAYRIYRCIRDAMSAETTNDWLRYDLAGLRCELVGAMDYTIAESHRSCEQIKKVLKRHHNLWQYAVREFEADDPFDPHDSYDSYGSYDSHDSYGAPDSHDGRDDGQGSVGAGQDVL